MKRYLIAGTALLMMAGSTLAQQPPAPPATPGNSTLSADVPPPPPKPHGPEGEGPRGHMPPPPPPRGAHIKVEDGDTKVDVRCAEADTTEACANIVMRLLDKS